ncbi:molecular chaperone TorD [Mannheimia granulomatis]|uniref:molecular chaperone TorD n=1 Tax=Mannheimia granulomatis TaxID=85402 RepID=UPI00047BD46A|nr:molecular chaperone TorD [Mannheimia granulomatis]QLB19666.1 molecular chaperone TorD [Mannheimia granulomatis]
MAQTEWLSREERQFSYRWFNAMLARELSDEQLNALQAGQFDDFFAFLTELGLREEVARVQAELTACGQLEFPRLELAADFAQLFLLDGTQSAIPYASAYLDESELTAHLAEMDRLLAHFSLQINRETKEPSDHLGVYLNLLDKLLEQGSGEEVQRFLQTQLPWLPRWVAKAQRVSTKTAFYQSLLQLLEKFVTYDLKREIETN